MSIIEFAAPKTDQKISVTVHRQLIVEKACLSMGTSTISLSKTSSCEKFEHPWLDCCQVIAYVLARDTRANVEEIAQVTSWELYDAEKLLRKVNERLARGSKEDNFLRTRIKSVSQEARRALDNNELPECSEPYQPPAKSSHLKTSKLPKPEVKRRSVLEAKVIVEYMVGLTKAHGFTRDDLLVENKLPEVVYMRDLLILFLVVFTDETYHKITKIVGKSYATLCVSLERSMKSRYSHMSEIKDACEHLKVDVDQIMQWNGRYKRMGSQ